MVLLPGLTAHFDRTIEHRRRAKTPRMKETRENQLEAAEEIQRQILAEKYTSIPSRYRDDIVATKRASKDALTQERARALQKERETVIKHTLVQAIIGGGDKRTLVEQRSVRQVLSEARRKASSARKPRRMQSTVLPQYQLPLPPEEDPVDHAKVWNSPLLQKRRTFTVNQGTTLTARSLPNPSVEPHQAGRRRTKLLPLGCPVATQEMLQTTKSIDVNSAITIGTVDELKR